MKIRAVIFDFDGVINDSASQKRGGKRIVRIVEHSGYKIPKGIYKTLKSNWGLDGKKLVEVCFGLDSETARKIYREWERVDATDFFPLIPGAKSVLEKLKSAGLRVFMLTSRNRENLMVVLDHFALTKMFDLIWTKGDGPFTKPDPRAFDLAFDELLRLRIPRDECLYIGDTPLDFRCTSMAGIECVSTLTGSFGKPDFLKAGQKKENIIGSITDLPKWIEKYRA